MIENCFDLGNYLSDGRRPSALPNRANIRKLARGSYNAEFSGGPSNIDCILLEALGRLQNTAEGTAMLSAIKDDDVIIILNNNPDSASGQCIATTPELHNIELNTCIIGINSTLTSQEIESVLLHEGRHVNQQGNLLRIKTPDATDISDFIKSMMVAESDSIISQVVHAYEKNQLGMPELWNKMHDKKWRSYYHNPLCKEVLRQVSAFVSPACDEAKQEMFLTWLSASPLRKQHEDSALHELFDGAINGRPQERGEFFSLQSCTNEHLADFVRKKDGVSYLDGVDFTDPLIFGPWSGPMGSVNDPGAITRAKLALDGWRASQSASPGAHALRDLRKASGAGNRPRVGFEQI